VTVYDVDGVWMDWFSESLVLHIGVSRMAQQLVDRLNDMESTAREAMLNARPRGADHRGDHPRELAEN
jgi:phosphate-selective porin